MRDSTTITTPSAPRRDTHAPASPRWRRTHAAEQFAPEQLEPRTFLSSTLLPSLAPTHDLSSSTVALAPLDPGPTLRSLVAPASHQLAAAPAKLVQPGADLTQRPAAPTVDQKPHDLDLSPALRGLILLLSAPADWTMDILIVQPGPSADPRFHFVSNPSGPFDGLSLSVTLFPKDKAVLYTIVLAPSDALAPGDSVNVLIHVPPATP